MNVHSELKTFIEGLKKSGKTKIEVEELMEEKIKYTREAMENKLDAFFTSMSKDEKEIVIENFDKEYNLMKKFVDKYIYEVFDEEDETIDEKSVDNTIEKTKVREKIITDDDVLNVKIALETCNDVNEFCEII